MCFLNLIIIIYRYRIFLLYIQNVNVRIKRIKRINYTNYTNYIYVLNV